MPQMLIANRLRDGRVVFRAADGSWVESIDAGLAIEDPAEADRLLELSRADEAGNLVIDPNLIPVSEHAGRCTPDHVREAIRATGPTIVVEASELEA